MNKPFFLLLVTMFAAAPALAQQANASTAAHAAAKAGDMLVDAAGGRLAPVDRVDDDGSAEIIIDGRVVTIPAASLSTANGHLTTNMTKSQVLAMP